MFNVLTRKEWEQYKKDRYLDNSKYTINGCYYNSDKKKFVSCEGIDDTPFVLFQYYMDLRGEIVVSHTVLKYDTGSNVFYFVFEHQDKTYNDSLIYNCILSLESNGELSFDRIKEACKSYQVSDQIYIQDHQTEYQS